MWQGLRNLGLGVAAVAAISLAVAGRVSAQSSGQDDHGRKYKPEPPTAHIVVTVEKGFNEKPLPNAAVVFHAVRQGKNDGNLEVKTDPDGKATIDVIEIGSHVTVQVIATGFATSAIELDVDKPSKELLVKLQRPRAQISDYENNVDRPAQVAPGVQTHTAGQPAPAVPASPAAPMDPTKPVTAPASPAADPTEPTAVPASPSTASPTTSPAGAPPAGAPPSSTPPANVEPAPAPPAGSPQ